jgi:hypothetical protein
VVGLRKRNFKVWQMAHHFGDLTLSTVIDIGANIGDLAGHYHLVQNLWAPAVDGTFVYFVRVRGTKALGQGGTYASLVKVRT